ncbi:hypothetical protein BDZ94DRAFT_279355 [Collybia nuda]|uniref:Zn(2)-C6 fungal-type domain-containing protein n=1 Tax=Collybia nuda TaxID=64659 RepID=A0A9P6CMQ7_9AGAR|nr:hypothetical protein BDZ94DRAFT_279355 [Collybia nuda]
MQEKSNKKVSRACNTCRLKRKKCDGLEPCFFCTENKLECSYSREPRRRGPPSGYLRYTETRVTLLETLLGLYIAKNSGNMSDPFLEAAESLLTESKTCTQDVWDGHKASWIASASSKVVEDLAMFFAPFHRVENEQTSKPLLPTAGSVIKPNPSLSPTVNSISTALSSSDPLIWPHPHRPATPTHPRRDSLTFNAPQLHVMSRESFERTQDAATSFLSPTGEQTEESPGPQKWPSGPLHRGFSDVGFGISEESSKSASSSQLQLHPSNSSTLQHYESNNVQMSTDADSPMMDIEPESSRSTLLASAESENVYTGSYWCELLFPTVICN